MDFAKPGDNHTTIASADRLWKTVASACEVVSFLEGPELLSTAGIKRNTIESVLVVPFNDPQALERVLDNNKGQIAAFLIEPVVFNSGCILPKPGYLEDVRTLTQKHSVALIFDEIITGFRLAPGGASAGPQPVFGHVVVQRLCQSNCSAKMSVDR